MGALLCGTGCVTYHGDSLRMLGMKQTDGASPVSATLYVELPTVEDLDAEKDFTPIKDAFAATFQQSMVERPNSRNDFANSATTPIVGRVPAATAVKITNYRPPRGGSALMLLGFLLPPLIGLAWSLPVGSGASMPSSRGASTRPRASFWHAPR